MAGLAASFGTLGVAKSSAAERAYDMLRHSSLRLAWEEKALKLDREGREVQAKSPVLAGVIGASQTLALSGAVVGGAAAFKNGVELETQKKKVEEHLVVEESLLKKLRAVRQKLKEERRASKARAMQVVVQHTDASHDRAYESVREMLKRGRDALNRKQAAEAASLFRQALSKAETITPFENDLARKAMRGLAAAAQLAGDITEAVKYMLKCLKLSTTSTEKADALGFMGDLYEESGDFEMAGRYYDKWLQLVNAHEVREAKLAEAR
jgi:tetratricopeptide (TPR) repeat protein